MNPFELIIGRVMPFVTLLVLVAGLVYRLRKWTKAVHPNITIHPPAKTRGELWSRILGEVILFSSFRKENRGLWISTWFFHLTLILVLAGHTRLLSAGPDKLMNLIGLGQGGINALSAWAGGLFGLILMVAGFALLNRRFVIQRVREISSGEDYWVWILLLSLIITGNAMRFFTHYDVSVPRDYFASLFSFGTTMVPHDPLFLLHFFMAQLLLIYLPFGKFLHIPGIFFSKSLVTKGY